ncbi:MAG: M3 family oligoendopeptidase [Anaerolineales bacterium]|nr:M3 family oligoendopeptidase [Anaerolineales bacterium]MCB8952151.1 M3 family oligoendopeptidase [Ardenticatenales bacterium]
MIPTALPTSVEGLDVTKWETFGPYFEELQNRPLSPETTRKWLEDWSQLSRVLWEGASLIYIAKSLDTTDKEKEAAFLTLIQNVIPKAEVAQQALKERLLALDVPDEDMQLVLRSMRNEADLFRDENVPLLTKLEELSNEYDKLTGGMKVDWDGEEKNLNQLRPFLQSPDRAVRERAWKANMGAWLAERGRLNEIYADMLALRRQVAENAGMSDFRAYAFRSHGRFDYTPEDCLIFHDAIAEVVVPAAQRLLARKRRQAGYDRLLPWDNVPEQGIIMDTADAPPLHPYETQEELVETAMTIFGQLDPALNLYFMTMADEELLDLQTRAGKALGGYCSSLPLRRRPFIFMNGVGMHDDVQTLLHEAGHAFHVFETADLPLVWQENPPMEFCEVASMSMELLAAPYLAEEKGGFYSATEAARARIEHLEKLLLFWPYMAVVDAFQHWVYTHADEAMDAGNCDRKWGELWDRFLPGVDWTGYEDVRVTGWHRKLHIFGIPFYYIEYGLAQVGALQVWRNSLTDPYEAIAAYRHALALGDTKTLPELFAAAGAEFRFDAAMLGDLVDLIETTIASLETELA